MPKVLLIDDDIDVVEAMKIALESKGYQVITANDGDSGYEKAFEETPDLIILDVIMPQATAGTVLREIRFVRPQLPVLLISVSLPPAEQPDMVWASP